MQLTCVAVAPRCGGKVVLEDAQCIRHRPCIYHAQRCGNVYKHCMVRAVLEASRANIKHHMQIGIAVPPHCIFTESPDRLQGAES